MIAQDAGWTLAQNPVVARAQAEIGELLQDKAVLYQLKQVAPADPRVDVLMQRQVQYESQLGPAQQALANLTGGNLNFADVSTVTAFAVGIEAHLANVRDLRRELRGSAAPAAAWDWGTILKWGMLLVGGFLFVRRLL